MAGLPSDAFLKLLKSGAHSDYRIHCNGVEFKVHKMILASASDYFQVICGKDGGFKENLAGVVDLSDDEPEVIARVIYFLYTGCYSPTLTKDISDLLGHGKIIPEVETEVVMVPRPDGDLQAPKTDDNSSSPVLSNNDMRVKQLRMSALTYQSADRLHITNLRQVAFDSFKTILESYNGVLEGLSDVIALVYDVTASSDKDLRLFVTQQCVAGYESVLKDDKLLSTIQEHEPVAWAVAQPMQVRLGDTKQQLAALTLEVTQKSQSISELESVIDSWQQKYSTLNNKHAKAQNQLTSVLDKQKQSLHSSPLTSNGAQAKFCPHCGEQKLVLASDIIPSGFVASIKLTTDCLSCGKKWNFAPV